MANAFVKIHDLKTLKLVVSNAAFIRSVSYNIAVRRIIMYLAKWRNGTGSGKPLDEVPSG